MRRVGAWRGVRGLVCGLAILCLLVAASVGPLTLRAAAQDGTIRVPILAYHAIDYSGTAYSVTPDQLDAQCRWLIEQGYTSITLGQFWDAVSTGLTYLPPNPVVLTDDDGWLSATTFADILSNYGIVGNYFINNVSPLTADQILSLSQRGMVEAHTVTHAHLASMDYDQQYAEIANNKAYLEQITGLPVRFLAWPFGEWNDSAVQAAADAGIVAAFGLGGNAVQVGAIDPYHIPRIMILVGDDIDTFAQKVTAG
jgi:peptidoglycan/xylan/chitin deacetylase (PgdA/CDA1 family)